MWRLNNFKFSSLQYQVSVITDKYEAFWRHVTMATVAIVTVLVAVVAIATIYSYVAVVTEAVVAVNLVTWNSTSKQYYWL